MAYIGDFKADTWLVINKEYKDGKVVGLLTEYFNGCTFKEICNEVESIVSDYKDDYFKVFKQRKSTFEFFDENGNTVRLVKAMLV